MIFWHVNEFKNSNSIFFIFFSQYNLGEQDKPRFRLLVQVFNEIHYHLADTEIQSVAHSLHSDTLKVFPSSRRNGLSADASV